ncbi:beta strand repeat-containing protein, partial [Methylobacterium segetis]|uniref:beta strand repeat-containing protein n=1 Tax=Methylobacterium segetis TaxID=2488750 RepID=UPI0010540E75
ARIHGLAALLNGIDDSDVDEFGVTHPGIILNTSNGANILLGGGGSDTIRGRAGNDIIDGDSWLNVRIALYADKSRSGTPTMTAESMSSAVTDLAGNVLFGGKALSALMLDRTLNPGQLEMVREILDGDPTDAANDVAVYAGVRAGYTFGRNTDGSWTVTDTDATDGDEGTDKLWNIETLRFSDRDVLIVNRPPTGQLTITGSENVLTANTAGIADPNGLGTFSFQWQVSADGLTNWTNFGGVTANPNLTIGNVGDPRFFQVIARYTDQSGFAESLTSNITARVGSNTVGDTITGSTGPNLINGRGANDTLNGSDGNDIINGGAGNDTLNGDLGNDTLTGGDGNDAVNGGAGDDTIIIDIDGTGDGVDTLSGGADLDTLLIVDTGAGNEDLNIVFGTRVTQVEAGGTINADIEQVRADLGAGTGDGLVYSATSSAVTVNLVTGTASGFASVAGIENVTGTNNADTITGNAVANVLTGGAGADTLDGGAGNDTLNGGTEADTLLGGAGNDTLDGGAGADIMRGGADNDTYVVDVAGDVVDETSAGSSGTDTVRTALASYTLGANVENLTYTGNGAFSGTGNTLNNVLTGGNAAAGDTLTGDEGDDTLDGNGGNDTLLGGVGNDTLTGGTGNDIVNGGDGDDVITWSASFLGLTPDGRDVVNGGTEGAGGDRFVVNGSIGAEVFRVYAKADAVAAGIYAAAGTAEIIVTRNTNGVNGAVTANNIISELTDIEEITINTGAGNDTVLAVGNFNPTSLNFNTITINGSDGDDTVDISSLQSAHRIVFTSNGGHDTVLGALRPQDVIELPTGLTPEECAIVENADGTTTMSGGGHSVTYSRGNNSGPVTHNPGTGQPGTND